MRWLRVMTAVCLLAATPVLAQQEREPQPPATLVADRIDFDQTTLTASGQVEVFSDGKVLRARRITYFRDEDRLVVEGPLTLIEGSDRVLVADFAELNGDLRNSVLRGARVVLEQKLQIAANEVSTDGEGRFTQAYQAVVSSCTVCAENPTPLWQIRARRIIEDSEEQQIYFENARFEVAGVPVFWFPRLRLPGPGLERSSGFLAPRFASDDLLGTSVTVPYFIAMGPSRDLTIAPYVSNTETRGVGLRYRQAFNTGTIEVNAAVGEDTVRRDETRGYVFAEGMFLLPRDYKLEFDIEATSDDTYLLQYGITEKDRLDSRLAIGRVERDNRFQSEAILFRTLREGENNDTLPTRVLTITREQRRDVLGGIGFWQLEAHARERPASEVPAGAPVGSARDVVRTSLSTGWRRSWVQPGGLVFTAFTEAHVDAYRIMQDTTFSEDVVTTFTPYAGLEARLPLARTDAGGTTHLLEPVVQVVLAPRSRDEVPNEDSTTPEFDEGNIFSTTRFPGRDERELGNRINLGLSYTQTSPSGWVLGGFAGRIIRDRDLDQFNTGTGLDSKSSDWLLSMSAQYEDAFSVLSRSTFDDQLTVSGSETILRWQGDRHLLDTRFTFLEADQFAGRPEDTSEWQVDGAYDLNRDWTARANWRYDFITNDASRAGFGLTYRSDCVTVDLDVERRFTSTTDLEPTTRFGLAVELAGFGAAKRPGTRARRCGI